VSHVIRLRRLTSSSDTSFGHARCARHRRARDARCARQLRLLLAARNPGRGSSQRRCSLASKRTSRAVRPTTSRRWIAREQKRAVPGADEPRLLRVRERESGRGLHRRGASLLLLANRSTSPPIRLSPALAIPRVPRSAAAARQRGDRRVARRQSSRRVCLLLTETLWRAERDGRSSCERQRERFRLCCCAVTGFRRCRRVGRVR
jgi:hypothetical protein